MIPHIDLAPKDYLLIWALIVTAVVLPFFFRKRSVPTRLNLESKHESQPESPPATQTLSGRRALGGGALASNRASQAPSVGQTSEKALNVFFQWNGHAWDAYEVLGLPAGSSLETVRITYQTLLTQSEQDQLPFFKAAFDAIVRTRPPSS